MIEQINNLNKLIKGKVDIKENISDAESQNCSDVLDQHILKAMHSKNVVAFSKLYLITKMLTNSDNLTEALCYAEHDVRLATSTSRRI